MEVKNEVEVKISKTVDGVKYRAFSITQETEEEVIITFYNPIVELKAKKKGGDKNGQK